MTDLSLTPGSSTPPPAAIAAAFGSALPAAQRYVDLLLTIGSERGLIGPREHDRVWDRHLANSAALAGLIPDAANVVDIGSGAGLPGIPLALLRPDLSIELLEPMQRRVDFLLTCQAALELHNVQVHRGRAPEDLAGDRGTVLVARAVAPLSTLVAATRPVWASGGTVLAVKGQAAQAEMDTVRREKAPVRLELLTVSFADLPATVVRVTGRPGSHVPAGSTSAARRRR